MDIIVKYIDTTGRCEDTMVGKVIIVGRSEDWQTIGSVL